MTSQPSDIDNNSDDCSFVEHDHTGRLKAGHVSGNWEYINDSNYDDIPTDQLYSAVMYFTPNHSAIRQAVQLSERLKISKYKMKEGDYTDEERMQAMKDAVIAIIKMRALSSALGKTTLDLYWNRLKYIDNKITSSVKRNLKHYSTMPSCFKVEDKKKQATKPKK